MHVNLLPTSYRHQVVFKRALRLWLRVWWGVASLCVVAIWCQYASYQDASERISRTVQQVDHLIKVRADVSALEVTIGQLQSRIFRISELLPPDKILSVCQQTAAGVRSTDDAIHLTEMKVLPATASKNVSSGNKPTQKKSEELVSTILLSGLAVDDKAISQLILGLREAPTIMNVTLKSSSHIGLPNGHARQFQIICDY